MTFVPFRPTSGRYFRYRSAILPSGPLVKLADTVDSKRTAFTSENMENLRDSCVIPSDGYIYFVGDLEHAEVIKIGWSKEWNRRLTALRSGYPHELEPLLVIPGTRSDEDTVLRFFADAKTRCGRGEWFSATETLCAFIGWLKGRDDVFDPSFPAMSFLRGRPNQLEPEAMLAAARTVTR